MIFHVTHRIRYDYSAAVFAEPHILRLKPRCDASQQVLNFSLEAAPAPAGHHDFLDAEGNHATCRWFAEKIKSLTLATAFDIQTLCTNPFSYLVNEDMFLQIPARYPKNEAEALAPYLKTISTGREIETFVTPLVADTGGRTIDFLNHLNSTLYNNFTVEIRHQGSPLPPSETLKQQAGACRDLAVLFIAACREVGIAARFVSGYQEGDRDMKDRHLHAWAEVYIPGGGWRGYDPTLGLAVADRHITLAASHTPGGAAPVTGSFRGTGVTATMSHRIELIAKKE